MIPSDWDLKMLNSEWLRISHKKSNLISISPIEGIHLWENILVSGTLYDIKIIN
jgi:hypothetical protein